MVRVHLDGSHDNRIMEVVWIVDVLHSSSLVMRRLFYE